MLYTGVALPVQKAEQYGLVTDVYETDKLLPAAIELAQLIATKAPLAVQSTKRIVNATYDMDLPSAQNFQEKELLTLSNSADHRNALQAFSTKQKPVFKGF